MRRTLRPEVVVCVLEWLAPDVELQSVLELDARLLASLGAAAVILDLDNTLIAYGCSVPAPAVVAHLHDLAQAGISAVILSNATSRRSREVAGALGVAHIGNAHKPALAGFQRALEALGSEPARTAVVGDQIFRDILGARRSGCRAILVRPLSQQDFPGTKLLRLPEALLMAHLKRHGKWPGSRLPKSSTDTC